MVGCIAKGKGEMRAPQLIGNVWYGFHSQQLSSGQRGQREDRVDMAYHFFSFKT